MNKLRFSGETEPWTEKKLGELGNWGKSGNLSKKDLSSDGNNKAVMYGEMYTQYGAVIRKTVSRTDKSSSPINSGTIIMPTSGENRFDIARASVILEDNIHTSGDMLVFLPKVGSNPICLAYSMNSSASKKHIEKFAQGHTVVHVSRKSWENMTIPFPPLSEQEKIGGFLSALDAQVENQSELVDLLALEYTGYSQQIFSQKLRFKDENGNAYPEWEQKKLGDLFNHTKSNGISKSSLDLNGQHKCFLYGEMYSDFKTIINSVKNRTDIVLGQVTTNPCIVIPASGESGKEIARASVINEKDVILGGDLNILAPRSSSFVLSFGALSINSSPLNKQISSMSQGSSIFHLSWKDIKELQMEVPCTKEQQKIGAFLEQLELRISVEKNLLTQLHEQKKAYLQKLLP